MPLNFASRPQYLKSHPNPPGAVPVHIRLYPALPQFSRTFPYNGPMPAPPFRDLCRSVPIPLLALVLLLTLPSCQQGLIGLSPGEEILLQVYRDSLLNLDLGYPEGWSFVQKTTYSNSGKTHDLYFEPINTLWTRRFTVKILVPDALREDRTLAHLKAELLERLAERAPILRVDDTSFTTLGGEPAFQARYTTFMDGKPFVRNADIVCLRGGRDMSLSFEIAEEHAEENVVLYRSIKDRFRFYQP